MMATNEDPRNRQRAQVIFVHADNVLAALIDGLLAGGLATEENA
jgi:hypothetical protein